MRLINHFDILDPIPESADLGEITRNNGQNKVTDFGNNKKSDMRLPIREEQCMLHPISQAFEGIAEYWSNFRCEQGRLSLTHSFGTNP